MKFERLDPASGFYCEIQYNSIDSRALRAAYHERIEAMEEIEAYDLITERDRMLSKYGLDQKFPAIPYAEREEPLEVLEEFYDNTELAVEHINSMENPGTSKVYQAGVRKDLGGQALLMADFVEKEAAVSDFLPLLDDWGKMEL